MSATAPTLPREVDEVLGFWRPQLEMLLGDALRGALLFGSVPLGGFEPTWSDLDVCTVLEAPVTDGQADAIGRLHDEMDAHFLRERRGTWRGTQLLEGPYLPADLASRPGARARCLIVGTGHREIEVCDPVPGLDRYMLAHHAVTILGDPPPFAPPSRVAIVEAQAWLPRLLARPARDHSAIMLAGLLQELARTTVFLRDGRFLSKSAALESEIAAGSPFAGAYEAALRVRHLGSAAAEEHRTELEDAYRTVAETGRGSGSGTFLHTSP